MYNFNLDLAVKCVKCISDKTQCVTCDILSGPCVRFPCGHTVCEDCAQKTGECLFCVSLPATYEIDKPQTARLNKAAALLTTFQDAFKIDVHKRQRISDHLRIEKQLFPECIQAAHKYSNKRKSQNISLLDKENISPKIFPGENIKGSDTVIMKKTVQYVQNWLNQHEDIPQYTPRKPFGDININTHSLSTNKSVAQKTMQNAVRLKNANPKQSTYRKRSHLKSIHKTASLLNIKDKSNLTVKSPQKHEVPKVSSSSQVTGKCEKNKSGIVIDDEPIVIEDADINIIDKDEKAWLAVLQAAERDECKNMEENNLKNERVTSGNNIDKIYEIADKTEKQREQVNIGMRFTERVLFYKKSSLFETCKLCNDFLKTETSCSPRFNKTDDISIVINNSSFITSIKFTHCEKSNKTLVSKSSVAIQTDEYLPLLKHELSKCTGNVTSQKRKTEINNDSMQRKIMKTNDDDFQSLDVFATDKDTKQNSCEIKQKCLKPHKCLVIEESDTDSNVSYNNTQEVEVEVHRPDAPETVECGILRTLSKEEYKIKTKRQIRGCTPNSSNSSDKENLDPNRKKAVKLEKKRKNKK